MTQVRPASDWEVVRTLFREYQAAIDAPICFSSFEQELATLGDFYLIVLQAEVAGEPVGCVALRALGDAAEMKRLYVRPPFRGQGIAENLVRAAADAARERGYERLLLDTLPGMSAAIALYERLGFRRIPRYNQMPVPDALFFELELRSR